MLEFYFVSMKLFESGLKIRKKCKMIKNAPSECSEGAENFYSISAASRMSFMTLLVRTLRVTAAVKAAST